MIKRMIKTASGTQLHNSSPAAIEDLLTRSIQDDLGKMKQVVTIKPFLQVDQIDSDLSENVKDAFGAIQITVGNSKIFIPFMIADKTLLPFDVIRLGSQEVSYDRSKLQRLVNVLDKEERAKSEGEGGEDPFNTMELAKREDMKFDNGFLGTIMDVRDNHQRFVGDGYEDPYRGPNFGVIDEERLLRTTASELDVMDGYQEVMEKIAEIKTYTPEQLKAYEEHIRKQAIQEETEILEKAAGMEETIEAAKLKRDIMKLDSEKLFNVHRAASGNKISFPIFDGSAFRYMSGRVYKNFKSLHEGDKEYRPNKPDALVLARGGSYRLLKQNQPFMASVNEASDFEYASVKARTLQMNKMYTAELDDTTVLTPFIVQDSYLQRTLHNDGLAVRYGRKSLDGRVSKAVNTLFKDVFDVQEVVMGKGDGVSYTKSVSLAISKDPNFTHVTFFSKEDMQTYITHNAVDAIDAQLAKLMINCWSSVVVVPENFEFVEMTENISNFYTSPDGLFKQGPLSKTASSSFDRVNKATVYLEKQQKPYTYRIEWSYKVDSQAGPGVKASKVERRSVSNLSRNQATEMLGRLGYDYRDQARFMEIIARNGRQASLPIQDVTKASSAAITDRADNKVKTKMKGIANSMLNSNNFVPVFTDNISDALALTIGETVPGAASTARSVNDFFGWGSKQAFEVAVEMEKTATKINGPEWHEISALTNMKYHLDKVAEEIQKGSHLYNALPVFEKVAEFKPVIEKKAQELINFNRKQLVELSSPIVEPTLVKSALKELDGLYRYASFVKKKTS